MNDQDAEKERTRAMTKKIHITRVTTAIAAVAAFSMTVSAKAAHTVTVAQLGARTTFKDLEALASDAAKEADLLLSFTQFLGIDHAAHRLSLLELKRDINAMGAEFASLESRRGSLDSTEQAAMDKVLPLFKETATNFESATRFYNGNLGRFWSPSYRAFAGKAASETEQIVKTIQNCRKYEDIHGRVQQMEGAPGVGASE
jgi:hypothetical protein